jgi:hypothetical protein
MSRVAKPQFKDISEHSSKKNTKTNKLCGLNPRANYTTEWLPFIGNVSSNFLRIEGATWSVWRIPEAVISIF